MGASARADALSSKLLNSPSATARAEDIGRAYATKAASRGSAGKTRLVETPRSASASDWREEVQRTREKLARSRELSSEPTPSASASEGARLDVLEDEDGEAVVEALDARLLATVETEREETSPSSALVAETVVRTFGVIDVLGQVPSGSREGRVPSACITFFGSCHYLKWKSPWGGPPF